MENINFQGKAITVKSRYGAEVTFIDGGNPVNPDYRSVVTFNNCEGSDSVLDGFTLTNGSGNWNHNLLQEYHGGGIFCWESSPMITSNTITGNSGYFGGGIFGYWGSSPTITYNTIKENSASIGGGDSL